MAHITLINSFVVPESRDEEFLRLWKQVNAYMQSKPGYLEHKLHRALEPNASFRFVNVARWASIEQFQAAHDAGFRELVALAGWSMFPPNPVLYEVIHEARAATGSGTT
jgi:heme-degrading monooxygenase HmoA